jgi:hypothetical protein
MNTTTVLKLDAAGTGEALHRVYRMLARGFEVTDQKQAEGVQDG